MKAPIQFMPKNQFWKFIKLIDWQQKENEKILHPFLSSENEPTASPP